MFRLLLFGQLLRVVCSEVQLLRRRMFRHVGLAGRLQRPFSISNGLLRFNFVFQQLSGL
jgi:hypothetical protein